MFTYMAIHINTRVLVLQDIHAATLVYYHTVRNIFTYTKFGEWVSIPADNTQKNAQRRRIFQSHPPIAVIIIHNSGDW